MYGSQVLHTLEMLTGAQSLDGTPDLCFMIAVFLLVATHSLPSTFLMQNEDLHLDNTSPILVLVTTNID